MVTEPAAAHSACTCFRLRKLSRLMTQRYDRNLTDAGLTLNQYSLLRLLANATRSIGELANELGMDRTTLTRNLRPLRAGGLVETVVAKDARRSPVRATAAGKRAVARALPHWQRAQAEVEALIDADATAALHRRLDAAIDRLHASA